MKFRILKEKSEGYRIIKDLQTNEINDNLRLDIKEKIDTRKILGHLRLDVLANGTIEIKSDEFIIMKSNSGIALNYKILLKNKPRIAKCCRQNDRS